MPADKQLNIYDIAKAAGVSIATVSRVLSGSGKVSPKTHERVMQVVKETNFTPNAFARGLGLGSMKMAGILCTDVSDAFYAKAVSIIERELRTLGFDTLLYCTGSDIKEKQKFTRYLVAKRVDAILLVGSAFKENSDNTHIEEAAQKVPVVIINGIVECENTYCVICDEQKAMRQNVENLYKDGCKNIAYMYHASTYSGMQKISGYREGLAQCGLGFVSEQVVYSGKSCSEASAATYSLIKAFPQVDAILTSEDLLAVGAVKALSKKGINMPVIGFDNSVFSICSTPEITSVDNKLEDMCKEAVRITGKVLSGEQVPRRTVLQATLVQRDTYAVGNH